MNVGSIPTTRINKDHPIELIIRDLHSALLTIRMSQQNLKEHCLVSYINKQRRTNHKDYQNCLFACFISQKEPKKKVWTLVDLPNGKRAIGTKWVFKNKKDEKGIVIRNKARLVTQGYTQEEGIDYDEVFAPVARIEAIRLFLAYASYMGFIVYQIDVKSAFLYGTIKEEVYVCQPPGFEDPHFPDKVYKVEKALYGLHQAPRAWYETLSTYLLENRFRRGTIDKTLFIKKDKSDILLVQVYVDDIIFGSTKKTLCLEFEQMMHKRFQMSSMGELTFFLASTPMEPNKALVKDEEAEAVDVHLYRSMIGSLMYLTASRPDIMFAVYACARDSPFDLEAFSDSDYAGASLDKKSTTRGCQFLGRRLISWQCKKQTIVANSTTQAVYVAAPNCCGQVLWIQNQMLDYGFNFMNTKIYTDNESTICSLEDTTGPSSRIYTLWEIHTRASNSELVEPLHEPERTLNRRLCRRNRRVPYDPRNNPPQHQRIVYLTVLNINYFCRFLDILRNYDPMDDEPMWAADHVVAPTPGSTITIPETACQRKPIQW
ncbi:putative ribonuclease H-like domain-containing protein [Tanacetum coccineum]